jgi:hypothetical protein
MVKSVSKDAMRMCEDPTMTVMAKSRNYIYKNQICDLCNSKAYESPISKCYLQGYFKPNYNLLTQHNCEHGYMDVIANYPFRNEFCQECNTPNISLLYINSHVHYMPLFSMQGLIWSSDVFSSSVMPYEGPDLEIPETPFTQCNEKSFVDVYEVCKIIYFT